jgi:hypothetical protein
LYRTIALVTAPVAALCRDDRRIDIGLIPRVLGHASSFPDESFTWASIPPPYPL